ncbi:hypothetical protein MN608_04103 [Microdochium nivale]|nr:hypothetical protein MN608_04103 [Microdochium nivale]
MPATTDAPTGSHTALTTYGGWAILLLIAGYVFTTYQNGTPRSESIVVPAKRAKQEIVDAVAPVKKKVEKKVEKAIKQKKAPKPAEAAAAVATPATPAFDAEELAAAERKADREFARQLSTTHAGHTFTGKKADEKRQKSVKQSKAEKGARAQAAALQPLSGPEDADDDLSSPASPVVEAKPASSNDVSDMLEASASGPSVLRLTGTDAVKAKQPKAKPVEVVESKKQRQNRKKAEAAKAAREDDEKERKVLAEQQRRTARIAEGRAAKDGSGFVASQQANAWTAEKSESSTSPIPLLDTFEATPAAPVSAPAKKATPAPTKAVVQDQFEVSASDEFDSWSEVKTKKKGKQSAPATSAPQATSATPAAPAATATNGVKKPALVSNNSSYAALATDDTDEVDEEWDV